MFALPSYLLLLATASLGHVAALPVRRATICNGHAELCDRSYGNVTFAGAHDSYAFSSDPFALAADQDIDVPDQLAKGIRLLQAQSHMSVAAELTDMRRLWAEYLWLLNRVNGVLHFCHTSCVRINEFLISPYVTLPPPQLLFDGGTVADYLATVKTFLDANPNEVLTLLFTNPEGVAVDTIWDPLFQSSGVADFVFVPPFVPVKQSDWPTLGEMIESGKRVVVFMDYNSDTSKVPYILPEFDMVWETPFDSTDATFPCKIDRISGSLSVTDHMNLLNHYLDVEIFGILLPDRIASGRTNGAKSIMANVNGCAALNGWRNPNFLLFDWVDTGDIARTLAQLSGLS